MKKHILLPLALLVYFIAMAFYGVHTNGGQLPENFGLIVGIEVVILLVLYWALKHLHDKRNNPKFRNIKKNK